MGAQCTTDPEENDGISFQLGAEKAHVLILKPEDLAERNAILDAILNLSALKYTHQLVYLAAPRIFGAGIDAIVFRSRGIGLLLYDERRIDEAVSAQPLESKQLASPSEQDDRPVVAELATLKTMYFEMERTINQLRNDLTALHNRQHLHQDTLIPPSAQMITTVPSFHVDHTPEGQLPSYFMNNPWLDVLSKRGTGEREPIAG